MEVFVYRKSTYQRQSDRFLIRYTEDDDITKRSGGSGGGGRPSATPTYDIGSEIRPKIVLGPNTKRWLYDQSAV